MSNIFTNQAAIQYYITETVTSITTLIVSRKAHGSRGKKGQNRRGKDSGKRCEANVMEADRRGEVRVIKVATGTSDTTYSKVGI